MKSKKIIIILQIIILIILGGYFFIEYATNIPELMNREQPESRIDWCDNPNDIACIAQNLQIINNETEICEKILKNPHSYFREDVERCKLILK